MSVWDALRDQKKAWDPKNGVTKSFELWISSASGRTASAPNL